MRTATIILLFASVVATAAPGDAPSVPPVVDGDVVNLLSGQQRATVATLNIKATQRSAGAPRPGGAKLTIELYDGAGRPLRTLDRELDEMGAAVVDKLPIHDGFRPVVRVTYKGVPYQAMGQFINGSRPVQVIDVPVYEPAIEAPAWGVRMRHVVVEPTAAGMNVSEVLAVDNPTDRVWLGRPDPAGKLVTLVIELPAGAKDVHLDAGFAADGAAVDGARISVFSPMPAGLSKLHYRYTLAATSAGEARLTAVAAARTENLVLFVPDDGTRAQAAGLAAGGLTDMGPPRGRMRFFRAGPIDAGKTVAITISGINRLSNGAPTAAANGGHVGQIVGGVALLVLIAGTAVIFLRPAKAKEKGRT